MSWRRNKSILSQLTLQFAFIIGVVGLLLTIVLYWLSKEHFKEHISLEVQSATEIIIQSLNLSEQAAKSVEQDIDKLLYYAAVNLAEDLNGKRLDQITAEELISLREKYHLTQISLCVEIDNHIVIVQSSDPGEIGVSSKDWGEDNTWTIALRQLIRSGTVDVGEGYKNTNYWVGPVAKSSWEDAYYKYAYYRSTDGEIPFLIAPYIKDEQIQQVKSMFSPQQFISDIVEENKQIESIAIINVNPWLDGILKPNEIIPERDDTVLFGHDLLPRPEDRSYVEMVQQGSQAKSVRFSEKGVLYEKHYIPLPNQRAMLLTRNEQDEQTFFQMALVIISSAYLAMLLLMLILSYVMTRQSLKPLSTIREHLRKVSDGNLSERIPVTGRNAELDQVSESINDMTVKMDRLIQEMNASAAQNLHITQRTYQEEFQNLVSSLRSFRHDMNNHFQIVWGHLQLKSYERAEEYFRQLSQEVRRLDHSIQIAHPTLSVLFFSKSTAAADKKINFVMKVEPNFTMDYPETDLIRIYGNLMDNAMEATCKLPEQKRNITVTLSKSAEYYEYQVENTIIPGSVGAKEFERWFEAGYTTKELESSQRVSRHGQGLAIVKDLVKKYRGHLNISIEEDSVTFKILLPNTPK
ncbi:GHKL domain-containing protein [Ammoniphilus sp. YIM 78166]|uniref:GHKL domain-containing protein n=1 Tax=Ammoniphilus sp. YIM 78166 TaxID=1644106 RepID=UPI0010705CA4|nr:GHKL domain-containing protein [Ammoniphilus sp. YIM 78166]